MTMQNPSDVNRLPALPVQADNQRLHFQAPAWFPGQYNCLFSMQGLDFVLTVIWSVKLNVTDQTALKDMYCVKKLVVLMA